MSQWPMVKLGDVARKTSQVNPKKFPDEDFCLYSIPAYDAGCAEYLTGKEIGSSKPQLQAGDVLLSKIVPHIRRSWVVESHDIRTLGSSEWIVFNDSRFDPNFLREYLLSDQFHHQFMTTVAGVGGSLNRARPAAVFNLSVPLPPLEEQRRIANLIKNADDQYLNTKKQNNLLKESILSFLVPRLRVNSKEVPLRNIITEITSGLSPKCESGSAQDNEYGVLKLSAVTSGQYIPTENKLYTGPLSNIEKYLVEEGDILMTRKNTPELVGAVAIASETSSHLAIPDLIYKIQIDESCISRQVFQNIMMLPLMRERIKSICGGSNTSMSNISQKRLLDVKFPLPTPELHKEMISLLSQSHKLEELHQSLATRAFAGQL